MSGLVGETRQETVTRILGEADRDPRASLNQLFPIVYEELRALARAQRRGWRDEGTLNTTGLLHEAYLRLVDRSRADWRGRAHFRAVAAKAMRHILIDHARRRGAAKRGGGVASLSLQDVHESRNGSLAVQPVDADVMLALDAALDRLEEIDERAARAVELRYFGGLTVEEVADAVEVSPATVKRDLAFAQSWLYRAIVEGA